MGDVGDVISSFDSNITYGWGVATFGDRIWLSNLGVAGGDDQDYEYTGNGTMTGNTIDDSVQVCKWLVDAGVDSVHVSTGSAFPHPRNPAGTDLPVDVLANTYEQLASSGTHTFRNLLIFRSGAAGELFRQQWLHAGVPADQIEGLTLPDARAIKQAVTVPVLCTGGFQTASVIRAALTLRPRTRGWIFGQDEQGRVEVSERGRPQVAWLIRPSGWASRGSSS